VNVGLDHRGVDAHPPALRHPMVARDLHDPIVDCLIASGPTATPQRPMVLASGILVPPTRVKSRYTRLARTSRSSTP
jgi:hypothetical protein